MIVIVYSKSMMLYYNTAGDYGTYDNEEDVNEFIWSIFSHSRGAGKRYQTSCCIVWICPINMFHIYPINFLLYGFVQLIQPFQRSMSYGFNTIKHKQVYYSVNTQGLIMLMKKHKYQSHVLMMVIGTYNRWLMMLIMKVNDNAHYNDDNDEDH